MDCAGSVQHLNAQGEAGGCRQRERTIPGDAKYQPPVASSRTNPCWAGLDLGGLDRTRLGWLRRAGLAGLAALD
eukprot:6356497-Pyramimonas_sp.AAC.1